MVGCNFSPPALVNTFFGNLQPASLQPRAATTLALIEGLIQSDEAKRVLD